MNSTDAVRLHVLPEPLANFIEPQIERAMLAYRKRCRSLDQGWQSLRALGVLEQPIESLLMSARYYGPEALAKARAACATASDSNVEAAIFVATAIEQNQITSNAAVDPPWFALYRSHPLAVRNALWFYANPVVCQTLLKQADPLLLQLGVDLIGRMTQQNLAPHVAAAAVPEATKLCTLGRIDAYDQFRLIEIGDWLRIGHSQHLHAVLEFLLTTGIKPSIAALYGILQSVKSTKSVELLSEDDLDAICALICIHATTDEVLRTLAKLPSFLWWRASAFLGWPSLLIKAFSEIENSEEALSREQKELILVTLGEIPAELIDRATTAPARHRALRELAAQVFRLNGCADITPEALIGWPQDLLLGPLWPLEQIRLRAGRPWGRSLNFALILEVSHRMRRWLYAEHAATSGRPFPLSVEDCASRQVETLQTLEGLNELLYRQ